MECNDRLLAILGYERGDIEMTGQGWFSQIHPDDADMLQDMVKAAVNEAIKKSKESSQLNCCRS